MPGNSRRSSKKSKLDGSSESSLEPKPSRGRPRRSQNTSAKETVHAKENVKNSKKSPAREPQRTTRNSRKHDDDVEDEDDVFISDQESDVILSRSRKKPSSSTTNQSKLSSKPSTNKNISSSTTISNKDNDKNAPSKSANSRKNSVVNNGEKSKQGGRLSTTSGSSKTVQTKNGSQNNTITRIKNSAVRSGSGFIIPSDDERKNKAKKGENVKPVDWTLISSSSGSESETSSKLRDKTPVSEKEDKTGDNNNSETSNLHNNNNNNNSDDNHGSSPSPLPLEPENNNIPLSTSGFNPSVQAFVDENMEVYKSLINAEDDYLKVPIYCNPVSFCLPQDQHWESIGPGVLMSLTFNNSEVKTGYLRIACKTIKPFEKTTNSEITYAVMEGVVAVKCHKFDFNTETGEPFLEPAEVGTGGHIFIPKNTLYSLENRSDELELSLYYCITRV